MDGRLDKLTPEDIVRLARRSHATEREGGTTTGASSTISGRRRNADPDCVLCEGEGLVFLVHEGRAAVQDCECVRLRRIERWREAAHLPPAMTFREFRVNRPDLNGAQKRMVAEAYIEARRFAAGKASHHVLVIAGTYGGGKSHLAAAIADEVLEQGQMARYRLVPDLLDELRGAMDRPEGSPLPSPAELVQSYERAGVLVLDDLGSGRGDPSGWAREQVERVINARYERGPRLVVTTNLSAAEMERMYGGRVVDRLRDERSGRVKRVKVDVPSYRTGRSW